MTVCCMSESLVGAMLLRRLGIRSGPPQSLREVMVFAAVSVAVAGVLGHVAALVANLATGTGYAANWAHWMIGHSLGTLIFTPITSLLLSGELRRWASAAGTAARLEVLALFLTMLAASVLVFAQVELPLLFLPMLPMMLAAFRQGYTGAAMSIAVLATAGVFFTVHGNGPVLLIVGTTGERIVFLQFYLATSVLMVLPVTAALESRRALFLRLGESEARYRMIAERSSDVILNIGVDGEMRFVSPSVTEMYGHDPRALAGHRAAEFVMAEDVPAALRGHAEAMAAPQETHIAEYRIRTAEGGARWAEAHMRAVLGDDGTVIGVVNSLRDISGRKAMESELRTEARTDMLTGLPNRRAFTEMLERRIGDSSAGQGQGCVALFDLDFFKAINDRYGHAAGDSALQAFAATAAQVVRQSDMVARFGGEEFALILWGAGVADAWTVCERLRERVAGLTVTGSEGEPIRFTVSAGIAAIDGRDADAILGAADEALYRAKSSGRNRLMRAA
jgi:diguanylate cyclase (GGDEF)-like protein/PAS domain S-box-containing protein